MLRSLLRAASATLARTLNLQNPQYPSHALSNLLLPTTPKILSSPFPSFPFSSKSSSKAKASASKAKKEKGKKEKKEKKEKKGKKPSTKKTGKIDDISAAAAEDIDLSDLPEDGAPDYSAIDDKTLDVGPKGYPLFTTAQSISQLGRKDICTYMDFSMDDLNSVLREGLPVGMTKEFEETKRSALLIRQSYLELRDNFRRVVDPPLHVNSKGLKVRKQIVLDGAVSCGKSIALAMLVHWARSEGWMVLYVPKGKEWTHGGFFYTHPETGLWDTPVQAAKILQDFLKCNEARLRELPIQNYDPIPLGEGAGVGWMKDVDSMAMPDGSTLFDLIQTGLTYTHAAVGVVVRLREELSLVKDIPVLIAIDQYNSWFTFSEYEEPETVRSCRPIHAKELSTVNAFRSMMHNDMMVGAFSHSTAVGKLRQHLPDVPIDARVNLPRYSLDEAATVCHYYLRQRLIRQDGFSEEKWKKVYYLANGNGAEMRWLVPFI
ncbi:mitochondrial 28S ribosomal protein S29-like protein [Tasmannia lanceolata]|uniref:mitochondrial 28S ribosomal protein S29-like protein n=1 Tax=Tasmannia lanceolata TaxID=3420 RepID=UPI0040628137